MSRLSLYAHSVRNQVGRMLGLSSAYTPGQIATESSESKGAETPLFASIRV